MSFETPKGAMTFRPHDHGAMMAMYHFRMKGRAARANEFDILDLAREIPASELATPIRNGRA